MDVGALYEDELLLESANLALTDPLPDGRRALLATLHWEAVNKPERDFKVSLRLLNDLGENAGQHDDFPIGSLIVPTLWNQGDEKPGYMAILLVPDMPPGEYTLDLLVYKPHNFETIEAQRDGQGLDQSIELARVHVDSDQSVEISSNAR